MNNSYVIIRQGFGDANDVEFDYETKLSYSQFLMLTQEEFNSIFGVDFLIILSAFKGNKIDPIYGEFIFSKGCWEITEVELVKQLNHIQQ